MEVAITALFKVFPDSSGKIRALIIGSIIAWEKQKAIKLFTNHFQGASIPIKLKISGAFHQLINKDGRDFLIEQLQFDNIKIKNTVIKRIDSIRLLHEGQGSG